MTAVRISRRSFVGSVALAAATMLAGCVSDQTTTGSVGQARPSLFGPGKTAAAPAAISFEPIVGPTSEAVTVLATSLANHATTRKIAIVPAGTAGATYRVKGYLTAAPAGSEVQILYVWDVFDAAERRISRIEGTETVPASGAAAADPWTLLDATAADHIAGSAIEGLATLGQADS
ncbi:MAG TPA: hypothetical protein PLJ34_10820 [Hyphomicrobiales bacterium]|nr:hypothetical protein [Hyphomicrobiales bacterium]